MAYGSVNTFVHQTKTDPDTETSESPNSGENITMVDSVERDEDGHVKNINIKSVKLPTTSAVDEAAKLATARKIQTDLASNDAAEFDGTKDIEPGVTGILATKNGGTGNADGKAPTAGTADEAIKLANERTIRTNLATTAAVTFDGTSNIEPGVTGILPKANGGTGNADGSAASLTYKYSIDGMPFDGTEDIGHFGICTTAASTAAKVVTCDNFTLTDGARISVLFQYHNTASSITLNVNGTGAVAVWRGSARGDAIWWDADTTVDFVYIGTYGYWQITSVSREGYACRATGVNSDAKGDATTASGTGSHSEGISTVASGMYSHAEGSESSASGYASHAEGDTCVAGSSNAHAEGASSSATGNASHAEGSGTAAPGAYSHAEGNGSKTGSSAGAAHAEGNSTTASGSNSHAEGASSTASASASHAEGRGTTASGSYSHAEGRESVASGSNSHAEGLNTKAIGGGSHAEGSSTTANNQSSHAEGIGTTTSGDYSHAEGNGSTASAIAAHAEGNGSKASGNYSHAEGGATTASGKASHAEGYSVGANGDYSHAEGMNCQATGLAGHAEGYYAQTNGDYCHAQGQYNNPQGGALEIGNGSSSSRSNCFRVTFSGQVYALSAFNSSGADYAEFVKEWGDGNPDKEDRVGYFVTLKDGKLEKAQAGDHIIGITSGNPSIVGNADEDYYWAWERDEFNRFLTQEVPKIELVEEKQEDGSLTVKEVESETETETRYVRSEEWNSELQKEYTPRKDRPEWDYVGMLGMLPVRDDGTCEVGGLCKCGEDGIGTKTEERGWDTYLVVERRSDNVVVVILK